MLSQLYIRNIAVISEAAIDFDDGLNVFTGETGAGKTMLISALNAVLGARVNRDIIRTGETKASVSALFTDLGEALTQELDRLGYPPDEDGLLISREISADGKSVCRMNGKPATASILREAAGLLISIHGQQDNLELLSPQRHLRYIDGYAGLEGDLAAYGEVYRRYGEARRQLDALTMDEAQKAQRVDMLSFQIEELEAAGLEPGEEEELIAQRRLIKNAEKVTEAVSLCKAALSGDDDSDGILALVDSLLGGLKTASQYLGDLADPEAHVQDMYYELEELSVTLGELLSDSSFDPRQLDEIESRLDVIYRLKKKYGGSVEDMLAHLETCRVELDSLRHADKELQRLGAALDKARREADRLAAGLTKRRLAAADSFSARVREELAFLDMPQVRLSVDRAETDLAPLGRDSMEFLISTNAGEAPRPLAKVASGGEMSRIMLAIKSVLAGKDEIGTLIFDEVDAGVSGRAAQKIGLKLRQVAASRQVICVTHLAQVAAYGCRHLRIYKEVADKRTYTRVEPLDRAARVRELARITGGENITPISLQNADEMLTLAGG